MRPGGDLVQHELATAIDVNDDGVWCDADSKNYECFAADFVVG